MRRPFPTGNTEGGPARVARYVSLWHEREAGPATPSRPDPVAEQIAAALSRARLPGRSSGGPVAFPLRPGRSPTRRSIVPLGILLDNRAYYEQSDLLERDMMRPKLLRAFGWQVAFVLAKDWYEDPEAVLQRLLREA